MCYVDIANFKAYVATRGQPGQQKVLEFMSKMLVGLIRSMGIYESYIAHMGGGHFVSLMNIEDYKRFSNSLATTFDQQIKQLYTPEEIKQGYTTVPDKHGGHGQFPLMALSVGVTHNRDREFKTAKKMFEVLAQVRQMAKPDGKSAVFVDRRTSER